MVVSRNRLTLLIAEDSSDDAELIKQHLERSGFSTEMTRVDSGSSFRAALSDRTFDLILCDWTIPSFGALPALDIASTLAPDVPVIIISGVVGEEDAVNALRAGAGDFVGKQNLARLAPAVERELRDARVRREKREVDRALDQARADFRELVNAAADPIFIRRGDVLSYANQAFVECLGRSSLEEVAGKSLLELFSGHAREQLALRIDGRASGSVEIDVLRTDGSTRILELSAERSVSFDEQAFVTIARDTTDRHRLEAQLIASERHATLGLLAAGDRARDQQSARRDHWEPRARSSRGLFG